MLTNNTCTEKKEKIFVWFLFFVLILQVILIFLGNIIKGPLALDNDMAKLYVHAIEMAKNKSIIIPDWNYITTLELDCSLLFAVPIFMLCHNIYLSFSASNLIFMIIYIITIFKIFREKKIEYALLSCVLILIPYGISQLSYFNMMFFNGSQYVIKTLVPLMFIAVLNSIKESERCLFAKSDIAFVIAFYIFLFITSFSSGIYVGVCGIFPICAASVLWELYENKKIEKISRKVLVIILLSVFVIVVGYISNIMLHINASGNSMSITPVSMFRENAFTALVGIFELFNVVVYEPLSITSFIGMNTLIRNFFVLMLLISALFMISRLVSGKISYLQLLLLSVFVWIFFVLLITLTYGVSISPYRYHLIGIIPLLCLTSITLLEESPKLFGKDFTSLFIFLMLLFLNLSCFKHLYEIRDTQEYLRKVCDYLENQESDAYCLINSGDAEVARLIMYMTKQVVHAVDFDGNILSYDYYNNIESMNRDDALIIVDTTLGLDEDRVNSFLNNEYEKNIVIDHYEIYSKTR